MYEIADFEKDVLARSRTVPVVVDFWAAWCGPCRVLGPIIERLAAEAEGRWVLAKVDTEAHPDLAQRYGIASIPNVKLFVNGELADEFVGLMPEPEIRRWLEAAIPSPRAAAVEEVRERIERRSFREAAERLRPIVSAEPRNLEARLLLAQALLSLEPEAVEDTLHGAGEDPDAAERAEAILTLARTLRLAGRPAALPATPAKDRFLAGAAAIHDGDYAAALEAFISVLRQERGYADGAAREAGRAIFVMLGIRHPISERFHRAFSSAVMA